MTIIINYCYCIYYTVRFYLCVCDFRFVFTQVHCLWGVYHSAYCIVPSGSIRSFRTLELLAGVEVYY